MNESSDCFCVWTFVTKFSLFVADEMLDIEVEDGDPVNDEELDQDVLKRAKTEQKDEEGQKTDSMSLFFF